MRGKYVWEEFRVPVVCVECLPYVQIECNPVQLSLTTVVLSMQVKEKSFDLQEGI